MLAAKLAISRCLKISHRTAKGKRIKHALSANAQTLRNRLQWATSRAMSHVQRYKYWSLALESRMSLFPGWKRSSCKAMAAGSRYRKLTILPQQPPKRIFEYHVSQGQAEVKDRILRHCSYHQSAFWFPRLVLWYLIIISIVVSFSSGQSRRIVEYCMCRILNKNL